MGTFGRILNGAIIGGLCNAVGWYCWTVLFAFIITSKIESGGEWGGNFAIALIGGIIGVFTGGIAGLTQSTTTKAVLVSGAIALLCFVLIIKAFLSNEYAKSYSQEGNYGEVWLQIFGFAGYFIILVLVVWLVAKIVLSFRKNY
jgi:hypothetical protein